MKYFLVFLSFLCFSFQGTFAATNKVQMMKKKLIRLEAKLSQQRSKAGHIRASIKTLEKRLDRSHGKHQQTMQMIEQTQQQLQLLQKKTELTKVDIQDHYRQMHQNLVSYLINFTSDELEIDGTYQSQIYKKVLEEHLVALKKKVAENKTLASQLVKEQQNLAEIKENEQQLYGLMMDLENQKKSAASDYISLMEKQQLLESRYIKEKSSYQVRNASPRVKNSSKVSRFERPIKKYLRYEATRKGVNFFYKGNQNLYAPDAGKVVYLGELASYGTVLMLEHDKQIRSVLLGSIVAIVKKGDRVRKDQLLGHTFYESMVKKPLYYEVRKKNIAQNTARWLKTL